MGLNSKDEKKKIEKLRHKEKGENYLANEKLSKTRVMKHNKLLVKECIFNRFSGIIDRQ